MRETDDADGECGDGTGRGVNMTSICGSSGAEVAMVRYHSWSVGNIDW